MITTTIDDSDSLLLMRLKDVNVILLNKVFFLSCVLISSLKTLFFLSRSALHAEDNDDDDGCCGES